MLPLEMAHVVVQPVPHSLIVLQGSVDFFFELVLLGHADLLDIVQVPIQNLDGLFLLHSNQLSVAILTSNSLMFLLSSSATALISAWSDSTLLFTDEKLV